MLFMPKQCRTDRGSHSYLPQLEWCEERQLLTGLSLLPPAAVLAPVEPLVERTALSSPASPVTDKAMSEVPQPAVTLSAAAAQLTTLSHPGSAVPHAVSAGHHASGAHPELAAAATSEAERPTTRAEKEPAPTEHVRPVDPGRPADDHVVKLVVHAAPHAESEHLVVDSPHGGGGGTRRDVTLGHSGHITPHAPGDVALLTALPVAVGEYSPSSASDDSGGAGPLVSFTPFDSGLIEQAVRQFLSRLETLGSELRVWLAGKGEFAPWLVALATTLVVHEMRRRKRQRQARQLDAAAEPYLASSAPEAA
jgi:hypothetical protein